MGVAIYIYGWVFVDKQGRYWIRMNEMIRIPATEYLCVVIAWIVMWFFLWIEKRIQSRRNEEDEEPFKPPTVLKEILYLSGVVFTYCIMVTVAILIQALDVQMDLIALMVIFVIIFTIGVAVSSMLLKQIMPPVEIADKLNSSISRISPELDNPVYNANEKI